MSVIDISEVRISGWSAAIRGMRNSRQSWEQSDSKAEGLYFTMGENDLKLAASLAKKGGSHAKFRRMIHVSMDISAPIYWWKEFDTYKIGTVTNSTSTMYSITDRKFTSDDFAIDDTMSLTFCTGMIGVISMLNVMRNLYLEEEDLETKQTYWRGIIGLLPESYKQLRTVDLNYEVLARIVKERKGHKLREWGMLINRIRTLPYAEELIFCESGKSGKKK